MKIISRLTIALCAAATLFSCAKTEEEDYNEIENRVFEEWMAKYAPQATKLQDGICYEVIKEAPEGAKAVKPGSWITADYIFADLEGNIAYQRSEQLAKQLGTYSKYTHYVPYFYYMPSSAPDVAGGSITPAEYAALTHMKEGEAWKLYLTSSNGYGRSKFQNTTGYGGQYIINNEVPMIIEKMEVLEVVDNPEERENRMVREFATASEPEGWGMDAADTLRKNMYMQILGRTGGVNDTIAVDSTAMFYYKGKFLDGFLFDTNLDSVWVNNFGATRTGTDNSGNYIVVDKVTSVMMTRTNKEKKSMGMPDKLFTYLMPHLRYEDSVRVVLPSRYAFYASEKYGYWQNRTQEYSMEYVPYDTEDTSYFDRNYTVDARNISNTSIYPVAEIRPYTPVVYEVVVRKRSSVSSGDDKE